MKTTFAAVLLCAAVSPALAEKPDLSDPKVSALLMERGGEIVRRPETCGFDQQAAAQFAQDNYDPTLREDAPSALTEPQVVYLNKDGGTYTFGAAGGPTSAATNNIRAPSFPSSGQAVIPPLSTTAFDWPLIVQCVKNSYRRFNVTVTEVEPTAGPYVEAVVGGTDGREVGRSDLFGIAATDQFCRLYQTGIAFNFAGTHVSAFSNAAVRNQEMCNTIAHEIGHVLGLEHEVLNRDHMSYVYIQQACPGNLAGCKSFLDMTSQCGTEPSAPMANCTCGGTSTNSYARLADFLGLRPTETVRPELEIISPNSLDVLPPTFEIVAQATDNMQMQDVSLLIDGVVVVTDSTPDGDNYVLRATDVTEGMHVLQVVATDFALNTQSVTQNVRIQLAQTGDECVANEACEGGLCAQSSGGSFCTEDCSSSTCPDDFTCREISAGTEICVPDDNGGDGDGGADGDGGGCCSTSTGSGSAAAGLLALGVGLVLSRRRRR